MTTTEFYKILFDLHKKVWLHTPKQTHVLTGNSDDVRRIGFILSIGWPFTRRVKHSEVALRMVSVIRAGKTRRMERLGAALAMRLRRKLGV